MLKTHPRFLFVLLALVFLVSGTRAFALKETEPNTLPEQANRIRVGEAVTGIFEDSFDHFRVTLPATGVVTVTVSGCPAGGNVQLGVKDFGYTGWEESNGGDSVSLTFNATSPSGLIWLKPTFHGSACGSNWCIARFVPNGPYNVTKRSPQLPSNYQGVGIHPEVSYQLTVAVAGSGPAGSTGTTGPATPAGGGPVPVANPDTGAGATGSTGGGKIFRDSNFGFSFELPAAMSAQLLPDSGGYLISGPPGSGANEVAIVVQVISKNANPGSDAEKQLKQARKQIKSQPGGDVQSDGDRRVAGRKAPYFVGSYRAANTKQKTVDWKHMQLVLDAGANYYWISFAAPEKHYKEHKEAFNRMLDTFSLR